MCRRRDGQAPRLLGFIAQPCGTTRRLANLRDVAGSGTPKAMATSGVPRRIRFKRALPN
jgi:hypothetical protein